MSNLMAEIEKFTNDKVAAQKRVEDLLLGLTDAQLQKLVFAATPETVRPINEVMRAVSDEFEMHPLAEHVSNTLRAASNKQVEALNDKVWQLVDRDQNRFRAAQDLMTGVNIALVYEEMLDPADREIILAPWRTALGKDAGV